MIKSMACHRRRSAVGIAFASGTEEPGSIPARVYGFYEVIAMVILNYANIDISFASAKEEPGSIPAKVHGF
jgi:hypothetical protein